MTRGHFSYSKLVKIIMKRKEGLYSDISSVELILKEVKGFKDFVAKNFDAHSHDGLNTREYHLLHLMMEPIELFRSLEML